MADNLPTWVVPFGGTGVVDKNTGERLENWIDRTLTSRVEAILPTVVEKQIEELVPPQLLGLDYDAALVAVVKALAADFYPRDPKGRTRLITVAVNALADHERIQPDSIRKRWKRKGLEL